MKTRFTALPGIALAVGLILGETFCTQAAGGGFGGAGGANGAGSVGFNGGSSSSSGGFVSSGGGGGGFGHSSGGSGFSHSFGGSVAPVPSAPSRGEGNFFRGGAPSAPMNPPAAINRSAVGNRFVEPPSEIRSSAATNRPTVLSPRSAPAVSNISTASGGVTAGSATANASAVSGPAVQRSAEPPPSPQLRSDWAARSLNRSPQWQQRVANRNNAWNDWQQRNQARLDNFEQTREQRWASVNTTPQNQVALRAQNPAAAQQQSQTRWDFRNERANEIRSRARDFYDGYFDDRWWGRVPWAYGYGYYGFGHYPRNPWWWWGGADWADVSSFVDGCPADPVYPDYGQNVVYDGDTVYVNGQPVPASQYTEPMADRVVNEAQPPPPTPPVDGQPAEWMSLGVFALAQEEKGDPILFVQLSVNREGIISGGYTSVLTNDQRPVTGMVDRATERVVWRIGANTDTMFETSLANLTHEVSPVAVHFGNSHTQTWLLVRMPAPAPEGSPEAIPDIGPAPQPQPSPAAPPP